MVTPAEWAGGVDAERPRLLRRAYAAALLAGSVAVLCWSALVHWALPAGIGDEGTHWTAVRGLAAGDWSAAANLPMLPGWHFAAARLVGIFGDSLATARGMSVAAGLLSCLLAVRWAARAGLPAVAALVLICNPLLFPFLGLAYTDAAAAACVLAAWTLRDRPALAALALASAAAVRQTNVVWVLLFAVLELAQARTAPDAGGSRPRSAIVRITPYLLVLTAAAVAALLSGRLTFGVQPANAPRFNPGQLHLCGAALLLLHAPLWLPEMRATLTELGQRIRRSASLAGLLVALAALVALSFRSDHPWNAEGAYVRNVLLRAVGESASLRVALAMLLVLGGAAWWRRAARSGPGARVAVLLTLAASTLFLTPQALIDPRYYIVPALLLDVQLAGGAWEFVLRAGWYAVLTLGVGAMIVGGGLLP